MTKADRIISELMDALDAIEHATKYDKPYQLAFIAGIAQQAKKNANLHRARNADGYLVVKEN